MIRKTSLTAYMKILDSGKARTQMDKIALILKTNPNSMSLREIQSKSGIDINAVSGRINDMKKRGYINEGEQRPCSITGRKIIPLTLKKQKPQMELF